jgi:hypothetical protein
MALQKLRRPSLLGGTQTNEAKAEATESETEETEAEEQESEEMEDEEAESSGSRLGTLLKGAGVALGAGIAVVTLRTLRGGDSDE